MSGGRRCALWVAQASSALSQISPSRQCTRHLKKIEERLQKNVNLSSVDGGTISSFLRPLLLQQWLHAFRGTVVAKQKWTEEEEAALRAGVEKYEAGKWRHIQKDSEFGPILKNRSNVDLKDKWRNLNMDSGGSRRDSRATGGEKSGRRRRRKRAEKTPDTGAEDEEDEAEYVATRIHASGKRRRVPRRRYDDEPESSYPEQIQPQVTEVAEENILAAMIQLQNPEGAPADTICEWLEDNYNVSASGKRSVKWMLKQMMEAGRVTCEAGRYKLAGFPQQMVEDSKRWAGEEESLPYSWNTVSNRTAKEAAEAAAKAVQEAEEAAELATELIAAADKFDRETEETVDQGNEEQSER